jgi:hypothetical protein
MFGKVVQFPFRLGVSSHTANVAQKRSQIIPRSVGRIYVAEIIL